MPFESKLKGIGVPSQLISQVIVLMGLLVKISSENYRWAVRCKEIGLSQEEAIHELIEYYFAHHQRIVDDAYKDRNQKVFDFLEGEDTGVMLEDFIQGFDDSVKIVIGLLPTKRKNIQYREIMLELKKHNVNLVQLAGIFNVHYKEKLEIGYDEDILIQISENNIRGLRHVLCHE